MIFSWYSQGTEHMKVSMELGCFMAGVVLSAQGPAVSEQIEQLMQPVKDFLGVLFFASIGEQPNNCC